MKSALDGSDMKSALDGLYYSMWNFQECIRNGVEYPGVTTKKPHRVSRGPLFWYWNFQGCNIFLWNCCNHEL